MVTTGETRPTHDTIVRSNFLSAGTAMVLARLERPLPPPAMMITTTITITRTTMTMIMIMTTTTTTMMTRTTPLALAP